MAIDFSGWKKYAVAAGAPSIDETQGISGQSVANGGNVNRTLATVNDGDLVLVMLSHSRSSSGTAQIGTVTSPNMTFTQRVTRATTTNGEARIYTGVYTGGGLTNEVITATNTGAIASTYAICLVRLSGADTSSLGTEKTGTNVQSPYTGALTLTVAAPTGPNSYIFAAFCPNTTVSATVCTITPGAGVTEIYDLPDTTNSAANWFVRTTTASSTTTDRTLTGTADNSETWAIDSCGIEITGF